MPSASKTSIGVCYYCWGPLPPKQRKFCSPEHRKAFMRYEIPRPGRRKPRGA